MSRHRIPTTSSVVLAATLFSVVACDGASPSELGPDAAGDGGAAGCALIEATAATPTVSPSGCAVRARDATACRTERVAAGLDGAWLEWSCRVELAATPMAVVIASDGLPDYASNYFSADDACHEDYPDSLQNPNRIVAQSYRLEIPRTPDTRAQTMRGVAVVGMAINGVPIYGNFAAPGDDIFAEARTFDRCGAHPQEVGRYHYHGEPYAISYDDDRLIGVMRDGYAIYGRRDTDGSMPALDALGGHVGTTRHSAAPVYHYHLNRQTSASPGTAGEAQWFLTAGNFAGTPGPCAGC